MDLQALLRPTRIADSVRARPPAIQERLSWVPIKLVVQANQIEIGTATGFIYAYDSRTFLITNYHVVAGTHPNTNVVLHRHGALPDSLLLCVPMWDSRDGREALKYEFKVLPLYSVADKSPVWTEHPRFKKAVDVVAIPLGGIDKTAIIPSNDSSLKLDQLRLYPSMNAFVLGFPRAMSGGGHFPIWKRATIATEPDFDLDGIPKLLIDTATRDGMSGAPVYAQQNGYWVPENGNGMKDGSFGRAERFLGVYSGRLGADDEFKAQLGIVWKESALLEIVAAVPPE